MGLAKATYFLAIDNYKGAGKRTIVGDAGMGSLFTTISTNGTIALTTVVS